jgi:hypothetical protein
VTYLAIFDGMRSGWWLPRADLIGALSQSWPDVRPTLGPSDDEARDVVWNFGSDGRELEIYAHKSGTCLYIDGDLKGAALFAAWYRSLVPSEIDVIFCDDSYSFNIVILPGMAPAELVKDVLALTGL